MGFKGHNGHENVFNILMHSGLQRLDRIVRAKCLCYAELRHFFRGVLPIHHAIDPRGLCPQQVSVRFCPLSFDGLDRISLTGVDQKSIDAKSLPGNPTHALGLHQS